MDENEKQKLRQRYDGLPDGTLLELMKDGEAGLVEGAYILVREEAIKRKLISPNFKVPESKVTNTWPKEGVKTITKKPKGWQYYVVMGLTMSAVYSCSKIFWSWVDSSKTFNTGQVINYINSMSEKDRQEGVKIQRELFDAMTADEREKYLSVVDRMRRGKATKADVEENGRMLKGVADRLPIGDRMEIVSYTSRSISRLTGYPME